MIRFPAERLPRRQGGETADSVFDGSGGCEGVGEGFEGEGRAEVEVQLARAGAAAARLADLVHPGQPDRHDGQAEVPRQEARAGLEQ